MPCVGFEPTITASGRAKAVYVLDRSAIVTGTQITLPLPYFEYKTHILHIFSLLKNWGAS
jgi:hypothetical protein